jgi:ribosomal protein L37AE/L43A
MDRCDVIYESPEYRESEPDAFYALCDAGEACPRCWQRSRALRVRALGVDLWQCPHCKATWFLTEGA